MPTRDPRILAFLLIAAGIGVLGWYGLDWYQRPQPSEAQIEEAVDDQLARELGERGPLLQPSPERLEQLRQTIRAEQIGKEQRARKDLQRWMAFGLFLCLLGAGSWLKAALAARPH